MKAKLVNDALLMALWQRKPKKDLLFGPLREGVNMP